MEITVRIDNPIGVEDWDTFKEDVFYPALAKAWRAKEQNRIMTTLPVTKDKADDNGDMGKG